MEIDQVNASQLKKLQKQLEEIAGKDLDLSLEKLTNLTFPVASYSYLDFGFNDPGFNLVTFWHVFLPEKTCVSRQLLDVAGNSSTADDGKRVLLLSDFICGRFGEPASENLFTAPVHLVATPRSDKPCYTTTMFKLVPSPSFPGVSKDVQITLFTWKDNGAPAPNISVDWRCRVPAANLHPSA